MPHRTLLPLLLCLVCVDASAAPAGIFAFTDDDGVEHFSNIPNDGRYRMFLPDRLAPAREALRRPRGIFALPAEKRPFHQEIARASLDTGVAIELLHAVIAVESGYRRDAVSPKGASGLMQLLPGTARRYGTSKLFDPGANVQAGARYLRDLLRLFGNDLELALAAYNAGENAVLRHGRRIPPYAETRRYVPLVVAHYRQLGGTLSE
ncbi:MAG: transglycosylase [Betaproteobacteria bacterium HGW-Betaproteobacteria-7]|jgi:hypothetical protein|nr:MAG: transglycosylase [Betaproteobacteria bacterium HGW-Betaproteobacteria-7]